MRSGQSLESQHAGDSWASRVNRDSAAPRLAALLMALMRAAAEEGVGAALSVCLNQGGH